MRIAIVNLTSGGMSGGYEKYLRTIVPLLRDDSRVSSVDVFAHPPLVANESTGLESPASRSGQSPVRLAHKVRAANPDVVFIPTARYLNVPFVPTVVMVRNMEPLTVPWGGNTLTEGCKNELRRLAARHACARADRVIAVSRHVEEFLVERWQVPRDKVGVVYHGVEVPTPARTTPPSLIGQAVRSGEQFIFTAGSIRPARGLEDLIRALPLLGAARSGLRLVIAGAVDQAGLSYAARLRNLATELHVADSLVWAGRLSSDEMNWCFQNCTAFVMTSRAEACPNIALEAMSHGALSISTDQAPMPEFFVSAAYYYRAGEPVSLARTLGRVLEAPPDALRSMRAAAVRRATDFPWHAAARATVDQLSLVVAGDSEHAARNSEIS